MVTPVKRVKSENGVQGPSISLVELTERKLRGQLISKEKNPLEVRTIGYAVRLIQSQYAAIGYKASRSRKLNPDEQNNEEGQTDMSIFSNLPEDDGDTEFPDFE